MAKSIALLLRDAYLAIDGAVQAALADAGFSDIQPGHGIVLRQLGEEGARPSDLAARSQVTRQAITKAVDELERLGLVTREPDPRDGRGIIVRYTPRGLAGLQVARECMSDLESGMASELGNRRWSAVREALEVLTTTGPRWPAESVPPADPRPLREGARSRTRHRTTRRRP